MIRFTAIQDEAKKGRTTSQGEEAAEETASPADKKYCGGIDLDSLFGRLWQRLRKTDVTKNPLTATAIERDMRVVAEAIRLRDEKKPCDVRRIRSIKVRSLDPEGYKEEVIVSSGEMRGLGSANPKDRSRIRGAAYDFARVHHPGEVQDEIARARQEADVRRATGDYEGADDFAYYAFVLQDQITKGGTSLGAPPSSSAASAKAPGMIEDILAKSGPGEGAAKKIEKGAAKALIAAASSHSRFIDRQLKRDEKPGRPLSDRHAAKRARAKWGECASRIAQLMGGMGKFWELLQTIQENEANGLGTEVTLNEEEALTIFDRCSTELGAQRKTEKVVTAGGGVGLPAVAALILAL